MSRSLWKVKPWRSVKYLKHVKSLECCRCGSPEVDPHHEQEKGQGGIGTTPGDDRAIPLCRRCHDIRQHGPLGRKIWQEWKLDPVSIIQQVQDRWHEKFKSKPWEATCR